MPKEMKTPRGTMRRLRRRNMAQFNAIRESRKRNTGTIRVNSPTLEMLNKYIGRPA